MAQHNIRMPPELERWLEIRLAEGRYIDASEYLCDLVRRDQEMDAGDAVWVRAMVQEGMQSGVIDAEPEDVIADILAARRKGVPK